jgi:tRNA pseudouridine55 synthase
VLGILLIDKPSGLTSHDVVASLRRQFGVKRVGHAGTLDPLATGLLVVAVGSATRLLRYMSLEPKEYLASVTFGTRSSTLDAEGKLSEGGPVPNDLEFALGRVLPKFRGEQIQVPPMLSAVKVQGKPLYKYARAGKEVEREERTIVIESLEIAESSESVATLRIVCSGGTYVRSLVADIGDELGCGAYLSGLERTRIGDFNLEDAVSLDEASAKHLLSLQRALGPMPVLELNPVQARAFRMGQRIGALGASLPRAVAVRELRGEIFGIARVQDGQLQPECVLPEEAGVA